MKTIVVGASPDRLGTDRRGASLGTGLPAPCSMSAVEYQTFAGVQK